MLLLLLLLLLSARADWLQEPLPSLLIRPLQRLARYSLFFRDFLKRAEEEAEKEALKLALEKMNAITHQVTFNEAGH
jgi:hypothetical protein